MYSTTKYLPDLQNYFIYHSICTEAEYSFKYPIDVNIGACMHVLWNDPQIKKSWEKIIFSDKENVFLDGIFGIWLHRWYHSNFGSYLDT